MREEWRAIQGFSRYFISSFGRVKNEHLQTMRPYVNHKGYLKIQLVDDNGVRQKVRIHRLVASAFLPNAEGLPEVNHLNFDKADNRVENLQWVTGEQNRMHYLEHKRKVG